MERITIALPKQMKEYVNAQIEEGSYGNVSEYIRDLIRHDQEAHKASPELEEMILQGIQSKKSEITPAFFDELREKIEQARSVKV